MRKSVYGSSRPEMFLGEGVLKTFSKLTGEHLCRIFTRAGQIYLIAPDCSRSQKNGCAKPKCASDQETTGSFVFWSL